MGDTADPGADAAAARRDAAPGSAAERARRRRHHRRRRWTRATPTTQPPATDVAAFEQTLHPLLRSTANFCVGCHGATQIPTFAVADVMTAYNVITTQQKVNLDEPRAVARLPAPGRRPPQLRRQRELRSPRGRLPGRRSARGRSSGPRLPPPTQPSLMSSKTSFAAARPGIGARRRQPGRAVRRSTKARARPPSTRAASAHRSRCRSRAWSGSHGGLQNVSGKAQANATDSRKLFDTIMPAGAFSVEAWIAPATTRRRPARRASSATRASTGHEQLP